MLIFAARILAAAAIWAEAEGESFRGKVMVGEVIRKRTRLKYDSDGTIPGTIAQRYQFSALNDDPADNVRLIHALKLDDSDPVVAECFSAWDTSVSTNYSAGALLYYNPRAVTYPPGWVAVSDLVASEGKHQFYLPHDMIGK